MYYLNGLTAKPQIKDEILRKNIVMFNMLNIFKNIFRTEEILDSDRPGVNFTLTFFTWTASKIVISTQCNTDLNIYISTDFPNYFRV